MVEVNLSVRPPNEWQREGVFLQTEDGTPIAYMLLQPIGFTKLSKDAHRDLVTALVGSIGDVKFDVPGQLEDYTSAKRPGWMGGEGTTVKVKAPGGGGSTREVRIPEGATFEPNGEIHVPARSLDSSRPDAKKFRRACRSARNAIREMAQASGKTVELVMLEIRGEGAK